MSMIKCHLWFGLLLVVITWTPTAALGESSVSGSFTRRAMLENLADQVLAPAYEALALSCRQLTQAILTLNESADQTSLEEARRIWLAASLAAARLECFQSGPIEARDARSTFYYWKVLPKRIESVLASDRVLDQSFLDEQGSTVKGLFALEYLLFDDNSPRPADPALLQLTRQPRRAAYLILLARDVQAQADQLARDWAASGQGSAKATFVAGGAESLNQAVNHLAQAAELAYDQRLNFVLVLPEPISRQMHRIKGSRSGSSLQEAIAILEGTRKLYSGLEGLGLDDALRRVNGLLGLRLEQQFEATLKAVNAINAPLEKAVSARRELVQAAAHQARALEIMLKVDLASALGVTITFGSADGD